MTHYFWKQGSFWNDFKEEITLNKPNKIVISSAYLSLDGIKHLSTLVEAINLPLNKVIVYCSSDFHETRPADVLQELSTFSTVLIVPLPFLHSKIYELHHENKVIFYHGSANLTGGGLTQNYECMSKSVHSVTPIYDFWSHLNEVSVLVTNDVIKVYQTYQKNINISKENKNINLPDKLEKIKRKQQKRNLYPDLTGFYFDVNDYETVSKEWYKDTSVETTKRRKIIRDKLLILHKELEAKVKDWDLHPHYHKDHITSGILPSIYNHGKVGAIWLRYGKHKDELNPYGKVVRKDRRGNKDPIEQFHKHACLQVSFVSSGLDIGMFHSTANDGIDRYHVREHWDEIKENIKQIYPKITGNGFVWHFYDAKNDISRYKFEIDRGTVDEFLYFYKKHDIDGLESFCMRHFTFNDERIKSKESIITEVIKNYKVLMPLYNAMTFRIPISIR